MNANLRSIGAQRLLASYQGVSLAGCFESYNKVTELIDLCESIEKDLPAHRKIVNRELHDFFYEIAHAYDELAVRAITWPRLDAVILEAVNYVAKGSIVADALRIAESVRTARTQWTGQ